MSKDPLFLTKLLGAVLVAAWIAVAAAMASWLLYRPATIDTPAYPLMEAAEIEEQPTASAPPSAEAPAPTEAGDGDLGARLAAADATAGQKVARKCSACHSFDKGSGHKIGPNLWDVVGRQIGGVDNYKFSGALSGHGGNWGYEELDSFLREPKAFAAGTRMAFAGIKSDADRADLIVYLRSLSDTPNPLP
ncbi:MAG: cytochrome c family protein [Rhodospirillales bacterium]|nr:MAG: cytochrome c family protein [Rhodospirillales bacterium]